MNGGWSWRWWQQWTCEMQRIRTHTGATTRVQTTFTGSPMVTTTTVTVQHLLNSNSNLQSQNNHMKRQYSCERTKTGNNTSGSSNRDTPTLFHWSFSNEIVQETILANITPSKWTQNSWHSKLYFELFLDLVATFSRFSGTAYKYKHKHGVSHTCTLGMSDDVCVHKTTILQWEQGNASHKKQRSIISVKSMSIDKICTGTIDNKLCVTITKFLDGTAGLIGARRLSNQAQLAWNNSNVTVHQNCKRILHQCRQ